MKYPKEYLEEIKLRTKVSQVVGKYVKLKKRGKEFIGLSPFTSEKTPSFTVSDEKGFYHCFSSGEHGNIFDFLMKTKNYKFGEAVRILAADAGMQAYKFTAQDEEKQNRWKVYNSILEKYADFCHQKLMSGEYPEINKYLDNRKTLKKEILFFKIGYAPQNNNFYKELLKEFNEKQINSSGIYYLDEKTKKYVDRFRGRIIFPVKNLSGLVIAFGGRSTSKSAFAKYINSPETEFYKKGNNLYNINSARDSKSENGESFVVEGYMDVINLHKFGISNVVANLGTAMTERQIELIWRFFKNPIICLDGDSSGQKAALRAAERLFPLLRPDFNISFLTLPTNLDPDSFINENGKEAFLELSRSKIEVQTFIWNSYITNVKRDDPHSLALFEKKIKALCREIKDKTLSKYFYEYFLQKLNQLTPSLNLRKNSNIKYKRKNSPLAETKKVYNLRSKFTEITLKEYSFFYLIINFMNFFNKKIETISETKLSNDLMEDFKNEIIQYLISTKTEINKKLEKSKINSKYSKMIDLINEFAPVKSIADNKSEKDLLNIFDEIVNEIKKIELSGKIEILEARVAKEMDEKLYDELILLKKHLKSG